MITRANVAGASEADERTVELRCNECGRTAGVIDRSVLEDLIELVTRQHV